METPFELHASLPKTAGARVRLCTSEECKRLHTYTSGYHGGNTGFTLRRRCMGSSDLQVDTVYVARKHTNTWSSQCRPTYRKHSRREQRARHGNLRGTPVCTGAPCTDTVNGRPLGGSVLSSGGCGFAVNQTTGPRLVAS
jgi:hypothetical protein